ncbi:MAG: aldo/keto reductase [Nitrososphaeraceae archaeon]
MYVDGFADNNGTCLYMKKSIKNGISENHFRLFRNLYFSSIGLGTYLGNLDNKDDADMQNAVYESVKSGAINVIDTAINYRAMRSEKSIGKAIEKLIDDGIISRNEIFISTKNGYITNDGEYPAIDILEYIQKMYITPGIIKKEDISSGYNVMNPNYISRCIEKSLANMKINTIDLVYIHNAYESWYNDVSKDEFIEMLKKVFETYEKYRSKNKIRFYGMATWTCFRVMSESKEYLSLEEVIKIAKEIGGENHGFRFIQLPYNIAYSEALFLKNQSVEDCKNMTILEAAKKLNIGVFSSVPLLQGKLLDIDIPNYDYRIEQNQILKLLQIVRSSPSIIAPLIGQKKIDHVNQNAEISKISPLTEDEFNDAINILRSQSINK